MKVPDEYAPSWNRGAFTPCGRCIGLPVIVWCKWCQYVSERRPAPERIAGNVVRLPSAPKLAALPEPDVNKDPADMTLEESMKVFSAKMEQLFNGLDQMCRHSPELIADLDEFLSEHFTDLINPYRAQNRKSLEPLITRWREFDWTPLHLHYIYSHLVIARDFKLMSLMCEERGRIEITLRQSSETQDGKMD